MGMNAELGKTREVVKQNAQQAATQATPEAKAARRRQAAELHKARTDKYAHADAAAIHAPRSQMAF